MSAGWVMLISICSVVGNDPDILTTNSFGDGNESKEKQSMGFTVHSKNGIFVVSNYWLIN